MRKPLALALILTMAALVAFFTKPSDEKCIAKAQQEIEQDLETTAQSLPAGINKEVWKQTVEKSFMESLHVEDRFLYKSIYRENGTSKTSIGWAALGKVQVDLSRK